MPTPEGLPPWRPLLRAARQQEGRSPAARWLQLATVAADGTPRVRTVVFRGWAAASVLDLLTDGRSDKVSELQRQPAVELCWLLPRARTQLRLRGRHVDLLPEALLVARHQHWSQLSATGRALWGWPQPGAERQADAAFVASLEADMPIPETFRLVRLAIEQVELLELKPFPHRRRRWCAGDGWQLQELNP